MGVEDVILSDKAGETVEGAGEGGVVVGDGAGHDDGRGGSPAGQSCEESCLATARRAHHC